MTNTPGPAARPRRFYKAATAAPVEQGYAVLLDGRIPRTPLGARLLLPTLALAQWVAGEWEAQVQVIDAAAMPATRLANTAIDGVSRAHAQTAAEVARYAGADLLCYRADAPRSLAELEAQQWDPLLAWAAEALDVRLAPTAGVVHRPQDPADLARIEAAADALDDFSLAGVAHAAGLFGSAILALALQRGRLDGEAAFALSRIDETFQERRWGVDDEAAARTAAMRAEALALDRWFRALQPASA